MVERVGPGDLSAKGSPPEGLTVPRSPVDKKAAIVTSPASLADRYETKKNMTNEVCSHTPPMVFHPQPGEQNLIGRVFGRFTVVGKSKWKSRWVVRCSCGRYSIRTGTAIRRESNSGIDRCEWCRHVAYLQHVALVKSLGSYEAAERYERDVLKDAFFGNGGKKK